MHKEKIKERIAALRDFLNQMEKFGLYASVLVAQENKVVLRQGYGYQNFEKKIKMDPNSALSIGSISKQFTATLILQLREQGKISIDDPLEKFFSDLPESYKVITIHQLLTHTSGIKEYLGDDFEYIPTEEFLKQVFASELLFTPGEDFTYSNIGYSLLGIIIERLTSKSYQENLLTLLKKIDITHVGWFGDPKWDETNSVSYYLEGENTGSVAEWSGSWEWDKPYWSILANGGVCLSTEDFYKYLHALFNGKLLTEESMQLLLTPEKENYAYGWDVLTTDLGILITHDGGNAIGVNSFVQYYQDLDLTIIVFSNLRLNGRGMAFGIRSILQPLLLSDEIEFPPDIANNKQNIELGKYSLAESNNNEEYLELHKLANDILIVNIASQQAINQIMSIDKKQQLIFKKIAEITKQFGEHIIREEWEQALKLTENKEVSKRRVTILTDLLTMFEKENGPIKDCRVSGIIPSNEYYAICFLEIQGTRDSQNIPVVFHDTKDILGFRPIYVKSPLSFQAVNTTDDQMICYSLEHQKSFTVKVIAEGLCQIEL